MNETPQIEAGPRSSAGSKKRPRGTAGDPDIIDVHDARGRKAKRRLMLLGLLAAVVMTCAAASAWKYWWQPHQYAAVVDQATIELAKLRPEAFSKFKAMNEERRLMTLASVALQETTFNPIRPALAEASLRLAMLRGSKSAALNLGKLYRDGKLGKAAPDIALRLFDQTRESIESGVRAGDSSALVAMGQIYDEGLGVPIDRKRSFELTLQAVGGASPEIRGLIGNDYYHGYGIFKDRANRLDGQKILEDAAAAGNVEAIKSLATIFLFEAHEINLNSGDAISAIARADEKRAMALSWYEKAAKSGDSDAASSAGSIAWSLGRFADAKKWLDLAERGGDNSEKFLHGISKFLFSSRTISDDASDVAQIVAGINERHTFIKTNNSDDSGYLCSFFNDAGRPLELDLRSTESISYRSAVLMLAWFDNNHINIDCHPSYKMNANAYRLALSKSKQLPFHNDVETVSRRIASGLKPELLKKSTFHTSSATPVASTKQKLVNPTSGKEIQATDGGERTALKHPPTKAEKERPPQSDSGFLTGEPIDERTGLSVFKIDNTSGSAGAIVRLYRGGKLPASYSFYVNKGDTFEVPGVIAGNYVMRYRNIGTKGVYEADNSFDFKEIRTETGIRYSTIRITLYATPAGNMKLSTVGEDKF